MSNRTKTLMLFAFVVAGVVLVLASLPQSALATAQNTVCSERFLNGGFESNQAWNLPVTAYRAAYSSEQKHSGLQSVRAGILTPAENTFSYSSSFQAVQIPSDTLTATLAFWWYPVSGEGNLPPGTANTVDAAALQAAAEGRATTAALSDDRQYALVLNQQNTVLARLLWTRSDARTWQRQTFDLSAFGGQTVRILFGVYNDGSGGVTALYVDDASLLTCSEVAHNNYLPIMLKSAPSTLTPAPTAPPTPTPTATPSSTAVWSDPAAAIELFSPVADALYHSPMVVNGFSRTFEGNVNLRLTDQDGQVLAERNTLGGASDGFAFFDSSLRFTVGEMISGTLEVFETSAKDGSEINKVTIPLVLLPGQRVIDLNQPTIGQQVCSPVWVAGYSNTFEAQVALTLERRDGTQLALTSALGGNLGLYADFSTTISHTVTTAQPVLIGAFEESAAGFGKLDYTRVPVELHAEGSLVCP